MKLSQVRDGEGTSEDQVKKKQKVTTGVDEANERAKAEEEGGGDDAVQQLTKQPSSFTPSSMIKESELIIIKDLQGGSVT
ncbi:hypothetical protein D5086_013036 [Populus alba]|uniref:Uncharacterized protein n=1 Tax=Populus alba TaxID=43335 RepID=A0ACC4C6L0_POPAL